MSTRMEFDEKTSRKVEAVYLTPDVTAQRCQVLKALALTEGEHVLDIGSGPGLLAFDMARTVGPGGGVCGIDISDDMLAMARRRCGSMKWAAFESADATHLPYADASFDAAVSTQVYEYVADVPAALGELCRVLRPGGRAIIVDTDYGSFVLHTETPELTARIVDAWGGHFVHGDLPRTLSPQLRDAGFRLRQREVIPMFNPDLHANTYGKGLLELMAAFAVGRNGVTRKEADAWMSAIADLNRRGAAFFSLNRYVFVVDKPTAG